MYEIIKAVPDVEVLLTLEPEELGAKLLFLLRQRFAEKMFLPSALTGELWRHSSLPNQQVLYPRHQEGAINLALSEAWAWLETQGLIVPAGENGPIGWRNLRRRARRFEGETEFAQYTVARMLPKPALNSRIAGTVWMAFMRGEFDVAVFQAMKA